MSNVIAAVDRAAVLCNAETHSELLDYVAPRLGRLANHDCRGGRIAAAGTGSRRGHQRSVIAAAAPPTANPASTSDG